MKRKALGSVSETVGLSVEVESEAAVASLLGVGNVIDTRYDALNGQLASTTVNVASSTAKLSNLADPRDKT